MWDTVPIPIAQKVEHEADEKDRNCMSVRRCNDKAKYVF